MLCIHGSGRNFYTPATANMANDLRNRGYAALTLNTRGHDTVWVDRQTGVAEGNAYEILDTGRQDLRAGIDYLASREYRRIGILGHSMGAVKVAYYAATENDDRVAAVVPVSPVRLSCSYYLESADAEEFRGNLETADRMEAEGRALNLFYVDFPIKEMFSAAAYLDKHGPLERYNIIQHAPNIRGSAVRAVRLAGNPHPPAGRSAGHGHRRRQQSTGRVPGTGRRQPLADQHDAGGRRRCTGLAGVPVHRRRIGGRRRRLIPMTDPARGPISVVPIGYVRSGFSSYAPSDEMRRRAVHHRGVPGVCRRPDGTGTR